MHRRVLSLDRSDEFRPLYAASVTPIGIMPTITIPESANQGLLDLARMSQEDFALVLAAVSEAQPHLTIGGFAREVAGKVPGGDKPKLRRIVHELFNIDYVRGEANTDESGIAKLIADSARVAKSDKFPVSDGELETLRTRIEKLMGQRKTLSLSAKASDVLTDQDRTFLDAKVLTDFRPVFDETADAIEAGVVIHNLVIHFMQDGSHKDFYVALDAADISTLREVLERAEKKEKLLIAAVKSAAIHNLQPE